MQMPSSLHTAGNTQSCTSRQVVRHAPLSHVNGAQVVGIGPIPPRVFESMQYAPSTQLPVAGSQRALVGHDSSEVHFTGHFPETPSQAYGAQLGAPVERALRSVHVPGVAAQVWHEPSHAESQQIPPLQNPLRQSAGVWQPWPVFVRQAPVASHVDEPPQVSGSSAPCTSVHLPGVALHV